jgi:hypothetical protein
MKGAFKRAPHKNMCNYTPFGDLFLSQLETSGGGGDEGEKN